MEIDAALVPVLDVGGTIDRSDAESVLKDIAEIKILVLNMASKVIDRAVQRFGGEGIAQNITLAMMCAHTRYLRLADGQDEVHVQQLGKTESKRGAALLKKIQWPVEES
jgi:acyl-CoA dehydrogenase